MPESPREPPLELPRVGDCHLWLFDVADSQVPRAASRVMQRLLVASYLAMDPRDVSVDRTCAHCGAAHGRPFVHNRRGLDFSVTHSGALLAIAFTVGAKVGIDVEFLDDWRDHEATARRVLSAPELSLLRRQQRAGQPGAFQRLWTRKEAVVKLTGRGLAMGLNRFDASAPDGIVRWVRPGADWPSERIHVQELEIDRAHAAALALTGAPGKVIRRDGNALLQ